MLFQITFTEIIRKSYVFLKYLNWRGDMHVRRPDNKATTRDKRANYNYSCPHAIRYLVCDWLAWTLMPSSDWP